MSTEDNKAIVRRWTEEGWNQRNWAVFDELAASNWVYHDPSLPNVRTLEDYKRWATETRDAFPDNHVTIEDMIAEGDTVVVRYTTRGTHQGNFRGIPPTGKQVSGTGMFIDRLVNGKAVEQWINGDDLGLLQQLGVIPSMG